MKDRYSYPIVIYRERDGAKVLWIGNFPGLNGCWAEGASKEEVLDKAPSVLHEYAKACRELEWPLPEPPSKSELEVTNVGEVFWIEEADEVF